VTASPKKPIRWPAEAVWEAVAPVLPGFTVEVLPEVDSTNSELMRRFKGGPGRLPQPEPALLLAEQQSAGRGRMGRVWQSQRGDSLMFSLGMALKPLDWSGLSLAIGVSLTESLEPLPASQPGNASAPRIRLKWPNDLWLSTPQGERKLAGILIETANGSGLRYVVIGVGVNIRPVQLAALAETAPSNAAVPPGCLQELEPGVDATQALLRIAAPLVQTVLAFEQFGFAPFQARFAARDALAGRAVQLSDGTFGTACGVSQTGALRVQTAGGLVEVTSSEVSVRPAADVPLSVKETRPC
jgi:BirA family biotin operon repressor/biotin-[acetyl-CoA-carboxylase] ligase